MEGNEVQVQVQVQAQEPAAPAEPVEKALPVPDGTEATEELLDQIMANLQEHGEHDGHAWYIDNKGAAAWAVRKIAQLQADKAENARIFDAEVAPLLAQMDRLKNWLTSENDGLQRSIDFFTAHLERYHRTLYGAASEKERAKLKTIKFPFGNIALRAQQPEVEYDDAQLIKWAKGLLRPAMRPGHEVRDTLHALVDQVVEQLGTEDPFGDVVATDVLEAVGALLRKQLMGDSIDADLALIRVKEELNKVELKKRLDCRPASEIPDGSLVAIDTATGEQVPGITATERPAKFEVKTEEEK